jgi:dihydroorotate dehydrogenase electron transfer subunit
MEMSLAPIVAHEQIAEATWRLRLDCPTLAAAARPGQFAMVRIPERHDPLLARPLAVYDTFGPLDVPTCWLPATSTAHAGPLRYADFVYAVAGKFTTAATALRVGENLMVWGPLGNGFQLPESEHLVLVAGGIGQTALLMLGRAWLAAHPTGRVSFCWGARHGSLFGHHEDFRHAGMEIELATLDGSAGVRGTVIDLLDHLRDQGQITDGHRTAIACCGPEPMMAAVSAWADQRSINCQVSLETPMACGIGICFSCVAPVSDQQGGWDYRRTCLEGPVFDGASIAWEAIN